MKYYLIVGEASGDLHASNLIHAIKQEDHEADFRFYGGEKMQAEGGTLVRHYREVAYMGFIPVLMHLKTILNIMRECKKDIVTWNPDVLILVDYPGFNLDIAKYIHSHTDIPIYYYISPKIWAWKEYRIKAIKRDIDEMFSILPFEVDFYKSHNYRINYVGNPCVDAIKKYEDQSCPEKECDNSGCIAILAGSRKQEIKDNLKKMLVAASTFDKYKLVIAGAPNIEENYYRKFIPDNINVELCYGKTYDILKHSDAALVTSGTATLETALLRIPQVVCYYIPCGWLIRQLRRLVLKVKYISLVNLTINKNIVTELVADDMNVNRIKQELSYILPGGSRREQMLADYEEMARILGPAGASERTAHLIVKYLKERKSNGI
ncbi:MAG: lipid-A-disaccharide synthase [Bacteroidaceae bacterium]|nr:lipid-A-disaccharide synthase [Bacteroidaceae bacterium]